MRIPKKIDPCPILEAVLEIRFLTDVPQEAIFGLIYQKIQSEYEKKVERMPALQIPDNLRKIDKNLAHTPLFRLRSGNYLFQIGSQVVSILNHNKYEGWSNFYKKIENTLLIVRELNFIKSITRIGLRYVNFFNYDVFKNINLKIENEGVDLQFEHINFRSIIKTQNYHSNLNIVNNVGINNLGRKMKGSIIDIDTFHEDKNFDFFSNIESVSTKLHDDEKSLFYSILKEDFIKSLNPEY